MMSYDPNPYIVRGHKRTMKTVEREDRETTRNSSFYEKVDDCTTVKMEAHNDDDVVQESSPLTAATVPPDL